MATGDFTIPSGFPGVVSLGDNDRGGLEAKDTVFVKSLHDSNDTRSITENVLRESRVHADNLAQMKYELGQSLAETRLQVERNKHEVKQEIRDTAHATTVEAMRSQILTLQAQVAVLSAPVPTA